MINEECGRRKEKARRITVSLRWYHKVLIALILFAIVMLIVLNIDTVGNVRYLPNSMGMVATSQARTTREFENYLSGYEFENVKVALTTFFEAGITAQNFQEIVRFEESPYLFLFAPGYIRGPFYRPRNPAIFSFLFIERENGRFSPLNKWTQGIEALFYDARGMWHDEDRVARDIVIAHVQEEITSRINGYPIFYGVGVGSPPISLSILGYEPDAIIPFEFGGEHYFFWYYRFASGFGELLADNIDITSLFTLAEVIELFDIQVVQ